MWKISNNMASVTLGSNSPTYNEALAGVPFEAAAEALVAVLAFEAELALVPVSGAAAVGAAGLESSTLTGVSETWGLDSSVDIMAGVEVFFVKVGVKVWGGGQLAKSPKG